MRAIAELKTQPTGADVRAFLAAVPDAQKRADCETLMEIMQRVTGEGPVIWGSSIVGFGSYSYRGTGGRIATWMATGFSPRKAALSVYIMQGFDAHEDLMAKLGHHKTGRACLYIKRLTDIDLAVLETLIARSCTYLRETYPDPE